MKNNYNGKYGNGYQPDKKYTPPTVEYSPSKITKDYLNIIIVCLAILIVLGGFYYFIMSLEERSYTNKSDDCAMLARHLGTTHYTYIHQYGCWIDGKKY